MAGTEEPCPPADPPCGLGLDAGGTQTRWALATPDGTLLAEGQGAGISGAQLGSIDGRAAIAAALAPLAATMMPCGTPRRVLAGVTGFGAEQGAGLQALLAQAFHVPGPAVQTMSDIELACRAAFAPGGGYVVYAGTGSIAAFLDEHGVLHRAGGRGAVIDDAGGGHWIAREALRLVWRAEDDAPGAWKRSPLAAELFKVIGGSDWAHTRQWVHGATRGDFGMLALAVAAAAPHDAAALAILTQAGRELARLALALQRRHGSRPLAWAGRAFDLHPVIENALRAALPAGTQAHRSTIPAHHAAARLAARRMPSP